MTFLTQKYGDCRNRLIENGKVLILDRDKTIIEDDGYTFRRDKLILMEPAIRLLRNAKQNNICCIVATNQSLINREIATKEQVMLFHDLMVKEVTKLGCDIEAIYICPHLPEAGCTCRKPKPAMFEQIFALHPRSQFAVVGDKETDMIAGRSIGATEFRIDGQDGFDVANDWVLRK